MSDTDSLSRIDAALALDGYARLPGAAMRDRLAIADRDWADFAASWNDLGPDRFMAEEVTPTAAAIAAVATPPLRCGLGSSRADRTSPIGKAATITL